MPSCAEQGERRFVDNFAVKGVYIAHSIAISQTEMSTRTHRTTSFLSAHPVFTRAEFAAAFERPAGSASITSLIKYHLKDGNIKRMSREVVVAVPAHLVAEHLMVARCVAASKPRRDGG